jgi:hypothetical protein
MHLRCCHRSRVTGLSTRKRLVAADLPRWTEARQDLPTAPREPALAFAGRVDTNAHAT